MDPFERHIKERGTVEDAVRAGRAVREVEKRSRRVSMKARTPQRPVGSDLAWIKANNRGSMANIGGQLNNSMASRGDNVAKAKAAGTFDRTRETYNTANAAKGYFMNEDGTIAEPGTAPKAPAPPDRPKGPPNAPQPNAPQPPAPPQAKTPAPPAPATPVAKAAPKTTPQMQEFFKSHAQKSGQSNKYFDEKGNPKGKQSAPAQPAVAAKPEPISIDQTIAQAKSVNDVVRSMQRKHEPENTTPEGREKIISSLPDYAPAPKVADSPPPVETPKPQPTAPPAMKKSFAGQIMENIKANTKGTPVGNLISDASKEVSGYAKAVAPGIKAVNAAVGAAVKPLANAAVEAPRKTGEAIANSPGFKGSQIERNIAAKKKPAVAAN